MHGLGHVSDPFFAYTTVDLLTLVAIGGEYFTPRRTFGPVTLEPHIVT